MGGEREWGGEGRNAEGIERRGREWGGQGRKRKGGEGPPLPPLFFRSAYGPEYGTQFTFITYETLHLVL